MRCILKQKNIIIFRREVWNAKTHCLCNIANQTQTSKLKTECYISSLTIRRIILSDEYDGNHFFTLELKALERVTCNPNIILELKKTNINILLLRNTHSQETYPMWKRN